ncbi:MAG TPA: ribose-5-phosphate isomerase [Frankiaceae bacterium]|jgi:ribose 5-phosphate isomerase B|nr:ribose-5-phosphate isomerase [Frankiaceae bacterium]
MRIFLGTDHAGFELKEHLKAVLGDAAVDCGAAAYDADDDYPSYCIDAATRAVAEGAFAVVIGGSGNGEQIAANKVPGARAALCWSVEIARLAREHNDANVCSLGARFLTFEEAEAIVRAFVGTAFSGDERHVRRIAQVTAYEATRSA